MLPGLLAGFHPAEGEADLDIASSTNVGCGGSSVSSTLLEDSRRALAGMRKDEGGWPEERLLEKSLIYGDRGKDGARDLLSLREGARPLLESSSGRSAMTGSFLVELFLESKEVTRWSELLRMRPLGRESRIFESLLMKFGDVSRPFLLTLRNIPDKRSTERSRRLDGIV
jgi:hypothetical protein